MRKYQRAFCALLALLCAAGMFAASPQPAHAEADIKFYCEKTAVTDGCFEVTGYFSNSGKSPGTVYKHQIDVALLDKNKNVYWSASRTFDMDLQVVHFARHTFRIYDSGIRASEYAWRRFAGWRCWWRN